MHDPLHIHQPTLPVAYPQLVLEIVSERGFNPSQVLKLAQLPADILANTGGRITPMQYTQITACAAQLLNDQGLGMEVGLRMRPTAHGFLGYAVMTCANLHEALLLSLRFMRLRQRHIQTAYTREQGTTVITLRESHDFGPVRHFFLEGMLIGMARSSQFLLNTDSLFGELWFDYPQPDYFERYQDRLPCVKFEMPSVQLRTPSCYLDQPLRMADAIASRQAVQQCERELAEIGNEEDFLTNLRELLRDQIDTGPGLDRVAASLFISGRTLKRRLHANGTSFQRLLDDVRFGESKRLMRNPALSLQQIAFRLGYGDPANFTRAFRKWAGCSPSEFRARLRF
ncbi:AraC family transcriptional regulator [Ketobacter nezhaii]|uniref:AraC family transcriptional regulator n=1 Tax=Ketobacter sp. MCCC 1A13808 TaxID=2602738 RepID=UPI0018DBBDA7|nr:AraC family transcriptional regulator [Ketobacter sp. MCCC 1A13808]